MKNYDDISAALQTESKSLSHASTEMVCKIWVRHTKEGCFEMLFINFSIDLGEMEKRR